MTKPIVAISVFLVTISSLLLFNNKSSPRQSGDIALKQPYLAQIGSLTDSSVPSPSASKTPTETATAKPTQTPTQLIPLETITSSPSPAPTATPTKTATPQPSSSQATTPITTPTQAPVQTETLTVVSLTTPIAQKQDAKIVVKSQPNANCAIEVTWPSGTISTSKDLAPKTADTNGEVVWTWGVNWNTKPGNATIKLSCTANGQTYSGQTTMQIIASQ